MRKREKIKQLLALVENLRVEAYCVCGSHCATNPRCAKCKNEFVAKQLEGIQTKEVEND